MSIHNDLFLDTSASRNAVRDALVQAGIGLEADADFKNDSGDILAGAISEATCVTIMDDLSWRSVRPDNGIMATRLVSFDFRQKGGDPDYWEVYYTQTIRGIMALLKAFPDADAYWVALDAEHPMLLRRNGHLVLAQQRVEPDEIWDPASDPSYVSRVDLPYTVEPLGPWTIIELWAPDHANPGLPPRGPDE